MYNWALARSLGGAFVLRIEDTDRARSTDESLQIILEGLALARHRLGRRGHEADGRQAVAASFGPYFQMQRLDRYRETADKLLASGHAYRCYCSARTPREVREEQKAKKSSFLGYDGHCRDLTDEAARARTRPKGIAEPALSHARG